MERVAAPAVLEEPERPGVPPADAAQPAPSSPYFQRSNPEQYGTRFVKIGTEGLPVEEDAESWRCALDEGRGLLWEVKTFDGGVADAEHTWTWFDENAPVPGVRDGGECFYIDCDTAAYVAEMNDRRLCGREGWRVPSFAELELLIDRDFYDPTINQRIFPHARGAPYLTSTELENDPSMVMTVDFFNGVSLAGRKDLPSYLRLVSGQRK